MKTNQMLIGAMALLATASVALAGDITTVNGLEVAYIGPELVNISDSPNHGDVQMGTAIFDGKLYYVYATSPTSGPIYAVPAG